jgi:hypothetical protein
MKCSPFMWTLKRSCWRWQVKADVASRGLLGHRRLPCSQRTAPILARFDSSLRDPLNWRHVDRAYAYGPVRRIGGSRCGRNSSVAPAYLRARRLDELGSPGQPYGTQLFDHFEGILACRHDVLARCGDLSITSVQSGNRQRLARRQSKLISRRRHCQFRISSK